MKLQTILFGIFWRLTIICLPWQTRWFQDASLGGWPWEQGRWSVYASMLLIVVTILVGTEWKYLWKKLRDWRLGVLVLFIALTLATTLSRVATAQWWIEVVLLTLFVWTVRRNNVDGRRVAAWLALSLVPHAMLAIWQYFTGSVLGSKWLGIAAHLAEELGVAVIEHDDVRILRAYGGFPHPNILGGWMAIGLVTVLQLASWARARWQALGWILCAGLMSVTLLISYSRSAWLAAIFGVIVWVVVSIASQERRHDEGFSVQFATIALISAIVLGGAVGYSQREHVLARTDATQRIEVKSVKTRMQSLVDGWQIFLAHPIVGTGPNAELVALAASCGTKCREPLEPPHSVFLLALINIGVIGVMFLIAVVWFFRQSWTRRSLPIVLTIIPALLLDHYAWSTWSGLCLGAVIALMVATKSDAHTLDK